MDSPDDGDTTPISYLPPIIYSNQREKVGAEEIDVLEIVVTHKDKLKKDLLQPEVPKGIPLHPLAITWSPETIVFEVEDDSVVKPLWIWNSCTRSIYIHCCDIWDEKAYLGAKWGCYPKTRFLLAPGLKAEMFVKATPKELAPVPCATPQLQLAAGHMRDHVVGFFAVPITVKFLKYEPYVEAEGGGA